MFAFTPLVWEYSISAEVFALNNAICAVIVYLCCHTVVLLKELRVRGAALQSKEDNAMKLSQSGGNNTAASTTSISTSAGNFANDALTRLKWSCWLGGLCCGCALANQHSSLLLVAFVAPCILITAWVHQPSTLLPVVLLRSGAGFLLGFSSYCYLPWASSHPTRGSWGSLRDTAGLLKHVLRAEYGTFRLGMIQGSETGAQRVLIYLQHASQESMHLLFPLLLLGAVLALGLHLLRPGEKSSRNISIHGAGNATKSAAVANAVGSPKLQNKSGQQNNNNNKAKAVVVGSTGSGSENGAVSADNNFDISTGTLLVAVLIGMWLFYVIIWHFVLSNLPLNAPMPFAVHSRFWMQPNIVLYTLLCVSIGYSYSQVAAFIFGERNTAGKSSISGSNNNENNKMPESVILNRALQGLLVLIYVTAVLRARWPAMDKSSAGYVLHNYGTALLHSVMHTGDVNDSDSVTSVSPAPALLLSHTDLDWNPVRYLQNCEGVGVGYVDISSGDGGSNKVNVHSVTQQPLITHLSFQLMPYPWVPAQQAPLYPHVRFPSTSFQGVSTDRFSEGNAQLILRLLRANGIHNDSFVSLTSASVVANEKKTKKKNLTSSLSSSSSSAFTRLPPLRSTSPVFPGGTYLDLQSVNEAEIEDFGRWRGGQQMLVPWGVLYRVFGPLHLGQIQELHHYSLLQLHRLQRQFPAVDDTFALKFAEGSWERAAANVYYDAHYQLGLNLLTYCIEVQVHIELKLIPLLLDRLRTAAAVLHTTQSAVNKYNTFSSSLTDLSKNTALAWMRLNALMDIVIKFRAEIAAEVANIGALPLPTQVSNRNDSQLRQNWMTSSFVRFQ